MSNPDKPNPNRAPWIDGSRQPGSSDTATPSGGQYASPYGASEPTGRPTQPQPKRGLGCWFWGCLGLIVFTLVAMVAIGFGTYYFVTGQVTKYTDTQPAEIPVVELDPEEMEILQERIDSFTAQVRGEKVTDAAADAANGNAKDVASDTPDDAVTDTPDDAAEEPTPPETEPAEPITELVLTGEELNALIASEPELRGRVFVRIEEGRVFGKVSIPTDMVPGGKGRFFNADAEFDVAMEDGILEVRLIDASVKGERIPRSVLDGIAQENLAKDAYNDPKNAEILRKFERIEVRDDSVVLKLKELP